MRHAIAFLLISFAATVLAAGTLPNLIKNGNMASGTQTPESWELSSYKVGKVALKRDTTIYKSAPASLLIQTDGKASGMALQPISPLPKGPIHIEGFARLQEGFGRAQIAVQVFDSKWAQIDWKTIATIDKGGEWSSFSSTITLPDAAAYALVGLSIEGTGKAWLDDVKVTAASAPAVPAQPSQSAAALPVAVPATDTNLLYVGRFDRTDLAGPRCAWPASSVTLRFEGTAANVRLAGNTSSDRWQVTVDDKPTSILRTTGQPQLYPLAAGLPNTTHTITLVKRTEAFFGTSQLLGFQLNQGARLLPAKPASRRIEVIGDSISAGYGNEASNQQEHFSPETENACLTYGALAAKELDSQYFCIAWSGKCMWPANTIPEIYGRTLPQQDSSAWDFASWKPEAVIINLGTNDFAAANPEEEGWVNGYRQFITRVRKNYPDATIFCAIGPMLNDPWSPSKSALSTCRRYLQRIVKEENAAGFARVHLLEFPQQDGNNGFGADWHPSRGQHQAMAAILAKTLRDKMGW